ncbi:hypothetical protein ACVWZA_004243 [Sphingomonas sp. UYAg733]
MPRKPSNCCRPASRHQRGYGRQKNPAVPNPACASSRGLPELRLGGSYMTGASAILSCLAVGLAILPPIADAQSVDVTPAVVTATEADSTPAAEGFVRIPANTPVNFEIVAVLSSKTSKIDEMFAIRMLDPVTVDGRVVLPAGTLGQGQVVHAAKATGLGKAGELILAARYLECGATKVTLRGLKLGGTGQDKTGTLMAATIAVGVIATPLMFLKGGETIIPAGTFAHARLSKSVDIQVSPTPQCAGSGPMVVPSAEAGPMTVPASAEPKPMVVPAPVAASPALAIVPASVSSQERKSE